MNEQEIREQICADLYAYAEAHHNHGTGRAPCPRCDLTAAYRTAAQIVLGRMVP